MPRANPQRREALADAAIALIASTGVGAVTHRALDRALELPVGTAANYFRTRDELLVGAARRVVELHLAEAERATTTAALGRGHPERVLVDLLTESLMEAATTHRDRYLAIFELQLEARRRPALAQTLAGLARAAQAQTVAMHTALADAGAAPEAVATLMSLYGGSLYALTTGPGPVDAAFTRGLVEAMVAGARALVPGRRG